MVTRDGIEPARRRDKTAQGKIRRDVEIRCCKVTREM
jgi:hypothetical protein